MQAPKVLSEMQRRRKDHVSLPNPYETPPMLQLIGPGPQPACGEESTERETQAHRVRLQVSLEHIQLLLGFRHKLRPIHYIAAIFD